ncbi:hypothetical protein AAU61_14410 [Desulfocarbo indianensis]|nr:hypothetical protein AAU61_14410 [Desulfocarbo indianensis]
MNWWIAKNARGKRFLHMRRPGEPQNKPLALARVWSAAAWPVPAPGYALTGCQTAAGGQVFLLTELESRDWKELVRKLAQDKKALGADLIFQPGGRAGDTYRDRANQLVLEEGLSQAEAWGGRGGLALDAAPYQDLPGFAVGLARDWLKPGRLAIMPGLERLEAQLKQLAALSTDQVVERLPELHAYRALVFLLSAFDAHPLEPAARTALHLAPADELTGI